MSLVGNIADVVTQIGTTIKSLTARVTTLENAPAVLSGATAIEVVASLPATPDSNTIYITTT